MRKLLHVFLHPFILGCLVINSKAQPPCCFDTRISLNNSPKIFFKGKAPSNWDINGKISEWDTILIRDPSKENSEFPFEKNFNWSSDPDFSDNPQSPSQDITLSAFTHDDYNVFFYFRRSANGNSPSSFYYFFDVNADGYMNEGEPVFHASFTNKRISSLTLSRYLPDPSAIQNKNDEVVPIFVKGKGDPLAVLIGGPFPIVTVENYPMPGSLDEVFTSSNIPLKEQLRKNEMFEAAITENGYGVELAIPWRYLKFWLVDKKKKDQLAELLDHLEKLLGNQWTSRWLDKLKEKIEYLFGDRWKNTRPLKPGEIFFYKLSMAAGDTPYNAANVVDNVGNCAGGVGRSGNISYSESLVLIPESAYRLHIKYTNRTNADVFFDIEEIILKNIEFNNELPSELQNTKIKVYVDRNCSDEVDPNEIPREEVKEIEEDEESYNIEYDENRLTLTFTHGGVIKEGAISKPFEEVCFIVDITLPPNISIQKDDIEVGPTTWFIPIPDVSDLVECAGRTINKIGRFDVSVSEEVEEVIMTNRVKENEALDDTNSSRVLVYPNPSNGTTKVFLPTRDGAVNITLEDYLGRRVQQWNKFTSNTLQVNNLKGGVYFLRVQYLKTGKVEVKKIVVQ